MKIVHNCQEFPKIVGLLTLGVKLLHFRRNKCLDRLEFSQNEEKVKRTKKRPNAEHCKPVGKLTDSIFENSTMHIIQTVVVVKSAMNAICLQIYKTIMNLTP